MPASEYFEGLILDYAVNGQTFVISHWYLGLLSSFSGFGEITDATYLRQEVIWGPTYYNSNSVTFASYPGADTTILSLGLWDSLTGGNLLVWGDTTSPISLDTGQIVQYDPDTLQLDILNS